MWGFGGELDFGKDWGQHTTYNIQHTTYNIQCGELVSELDFGNIKEMDKGPYSAIHHVKWLFMGKNTYCYSRHGIETHDKRPIQ
jgi:hypothetical protein